MNMQGIQLDKFEIGGEDLWAPVRQSPWADLSGQQVGETENRRRVALEDIRVRVGTLLKTETVSFLLGAGASVDCGGPLMGSVPLTLEHYLQQKGIVGTRRLRISQWLYLLYRAARWAGADDAPITREAILDRCDAVKKGSAEPLKANFEKVLSTLYRWRLALPDSGGRIRIDGSPDVKAKAEHLEQALGEATSALARCCSLPVAGKEVGLSTYTTFMRKILTRPVNLTRINLFTLNYDTLVEQAADAEGVVLLDGFVGTHRRIFRPESFEQDLYFPAETTEGRVHRFDRVLHLYKLHGSITWMASEPTIENPYGVESAASTPGGVKRILIYPTPAKYSEMLGIPYSEMFRRFATTIVRPQSVLFVIGYGFGDEHVTAIIRQALAVPSFTLVIVDPSPKSDFVSLLRERHDKRVWVAEGPTLGTFAGFVQHVLPDLQDEEMRKKVLATHKALSRTFTDAGGEANGC